MQVFGNDFQRVFSKHVPYLFLLLTSLALTAITIHNYPAFNTDGVTILNAAKILFSQGFLAATHSGPHTNWPLYFLTIAFASKCLGVSVLKAAYILNYLFYALRDLLFVFIVSELGGKKREIWMAIGIILIFHAYRSEILRGQAYWFISLFAFLSLLRFSQSLSWKSALSWSFSSLVAMLFRVEGVVFLLFVPLVVFFFRSIDFKERAKSILKLYFLVILAAIFLVLADIFLRSQNININVFGRIPEIFHRLTAGLKDNYSSFLVRASYIHSHLYLSNANRLLLFGMIGEFCFILLQGLSIPVAITIFYAFMNKNLKCPWNTRWIFAFYIGLNLIVLSIFFWIYVFASTRYCYFMLTILLLAAPFGFSSMYEKWCSLSKKCSYFGVLFIVTCLMFAGMAVARIHRFGPSKNYLYDGGAWINNHALPFERVYTNNDRLGYFSGRDFKVDVLATDFVTASSPPWAGFDYLAIEFSLYQQGQIPKLLQTLKVQPMKEIDYNRRNIRLLIFKLPKS